MQSLLAKIIVGTLTSLITLMGVGSLVKPQNTPNQLFGAFSTPSSGSSVTSAPLTGAINMGGYPITNGGTITATNFVGTSTTATSSFPGGITGPDSFVVQQTSGNVGINTVTPDSKLDIEQGDLRFTNVSAPSVPTTALGAAGVLTGTYSYRISYVTATGETEPSPLATQQSPVAQQINLSNIPISSDAGVIGRRIYRNKNADGIYKAMYVVTTINDNTTTTYSDNIADASLGNINTMIQTTGGVIYAKSTPFIVGNSQQTSFGIGALQSNAAPSNSSFGYHALFNNTTGGFNNAFGNGTLAANTTANTNNAFGTNALSSVTVNGNNSAFGNNSLQATTGDSNTGLGSGAGLSNSSGTNNTAVGTSAMYRTQTGSNNTAIGSNAGYGVTANTYSNNTLLGYSAGYGLTTGSTNTVLGYNAGYNLTTGGSNVIIGGSAYAPDPAATGQLNIQNIIYGTNNTGTGLTVSTGNIGIATTTPQEKLTVAGNIQIRKNLPYLSIGRPTSSGDGTLGVASNANDWQTGSIAGDVILRAESSTNRLLIGASTGIPTMTLTNTRIGVGTTTPQRTLSVSSGASATTTVQIGDIYSGTGKGCVEMPNTTGAVTSFYFVGTTMVVEPNACK